MGKNRKRWLLLLGAWALLGVFLLMAGSQRGDGEPDSWHLSDFDRVFTQNYQTARDTYELLPDSGQVGSVTVLRGAQEGPAVYIVAGVHGDEVAGWRAADLLKEADIQAGTVYILSPANRYGADQNQRETKAKWDLNRHFPGKPEGTDAERIAWAIYCDIRDKSPDIVLDLHEAHPKEDDYEKLGASYDALGNTLICQSLDGIGDLVTEAVLASQQGTLCASPLDLFGSPPQGSVNHTVRTELEIPAITVETLRTEPLRQRVGNHLELAQFVLRYYGMI